MLSETHKHLSYARAIQECAEQFICSNCIKQIQQALDDKNAILQSKHSAIFASEETDAGNGDAPKLTVASVFLPLQIDFMRLAIAAPIVAQYLIYEPSKCIDILATAAYNVQKDILSYRSDEPFRSAPSDENLLFKSTQIQIIEKDVSATPVFSYEGFSIRILQFITPIRTLRSLASRDIGQLIKISGTVSTISERKLVLVERDYLCTRCRKVTRVHADIAQRYRLMPPQCCQYCLSKDTKQHQRPNDTNQKTLDFMKFAQGGKNNLKSSFGETFQQIESQKERWMDFQEIAICEQVTFATQNVATSKYLTIVLQRDLVDQITVGQEITALGVPTMQWLAPPYHGTACVPRMVLFANNVNILSEYSKKSASTYEILSNQLVLKDSILNRNTPMSLDGRDSFVNSLFPSIFGDLNIKLALLLSLIGGVKQETSGGIKRRSTCHILLNGPVCTAKTMFLKQALRLSALKRKGRGGVLITGTGTTTAGLTAAAVREAGEGDSSWHLEAGALVLSTGGVCCIDDFHKLNASVRLSLLEAMEQQHVSVAKAGMISSLPAECSVIAAATKNRPKSDFSVSKDNGLEMNLPLLSRFDLIFFLRDKASAENDSGLIEFFFESKETIHPDESIEFKCAYIRHAASRECSTEIPSHLHPIIIAYYEHLVEYHQTRSFPILESGECPITVRALESLIRLSQAHAKLMNREIVESEDVLSIVWLYENSVLGSNLIQSVSTNDAINYREVFDWLEWGLKNSKS